MNTDRINLPDLTVEAKVKLMQDIIAEEKLHQLVYDTIAKVIVQHRDRKRIDKKFQDALKAALPDNQVWVTVSTHQHEVEIGVQGGGIDYPDRIWIKVWGEMDENYNRTPATWGQLLEQLRRYDTTSQIESCEQAIRKMDYLQIREEELIRLKELVKSATGSIPHIAEKMFPNIYK